MNSGGQYTIGVENDAFILETNSFKTERDSILHSGIYSRELASSLAAGACIVLAGFFFAGRVKITAVYYAAALFLFITLTLFFRTYIFKEPVLRVIFDKGNGEVSIDLNSVLKKRSLSFPLDDLAELKQNYISSAPENPDGVKIVEKIALQHGTAIPGFGEPLELHTIEMEFKSGEHFIIFSSKEASRSETVYSNLKKYINIQG